MPLWKRKGIVACLAVLVVLVALSFSTPTPFQSFKEILPSLGVVVALLTFMFGIHQYGVAQQWKRAEFVAKQIKEFEDDTVVRNAMLMLDWNERKIAFSDCTIERVTEDFLKVCLISGGNLDEMRSNLEELKKRQGLTQEQPQEFTIEEAAVRDAFSRFLDYLERFENFIKAGLVSEEEFKPYLVYWLKIIARKDKKPIKSLEFHQSLWDFIDSYGYTGVRNLLKRYDCNIPFL